MISSIVTGDGTITLFVKTSTYTISPDSIYYARVKENLKSKNEDELIKLCDLDLSFKSKSHGKVSYEDGVIKYNGQVINNALTKRIFELDKLDFDFEPLVKFLENVLKNPDNDVVNRLYAFLEHQCILIDSEGYVVGYKKVDNEGWDFHSHTIQYKVGGVYEELRERCDSNPGNDCSYGLHIGSQDYAKQFHGGSGKIVVCKTHPKDVVSVPYDCGSSKLRTCKLEVISEWQEVRPFNYLDEEISGVSKNSVEIDNEVEVEEEGIPVDREYHLKKTEVIALLNTFIINELWDTEFSWQDEANYPVNDFLSTGEMKELENFIKIRFQMILIVAGNYCLTFNSLAEIITAKQLEASTPSILPVNPPSAPQRDSNGRFIPKDKVKTAVVATCGAPKRDANGRFIKK